MWRCCQTKCKSSVLTKDDTILKNIRCHDHRADNGRNNAVALTHNMRKRCRTEPTPVMKIYEEERQKYMMQNHIIWDNISFFKSEQRNKEAYILQLEGGQEAP